MKNDRVSREIAAIKQSRADDRPPRGRYHRERERLERAMGIQPDGSIRR